MSIQQYQYTERGMKQDAIQAMRGDLSRGLIELITNSDDAYRDKPGGIRVEIERRRRENNSSIVVRDRACGMTSSEMIEAFGNIGGRTSGFEKGYSVRGNLGRGAKDLVALGEVVYESIKAGQYSKITLTTGGFIPGAPRRANSQDFERLGIKHSGTVATIKLDKNVRIKVLETLKENLENNYQLRDICSASDRKVTLCEPGKEVVLAYSEPNRSLLYAGVMEIADYPCTAKIEIYRNLECFDHPASDPTRPEGFLVVGKKAVYDNTLFGFESTHESGWFSGRIECPYIDDLIRDFDDQLLENQRVESNPLPLISRTRDGLVKEHPFFLALSSAVGELLLPLIAEEKAKARQLPAQLTDQLRKQLTGLGKDLAPSINEDLQAIDEDGGGGGEPDAVAKLSIIPPKIVLIEGASKTVSVLFSEELGKNITAIIEGRDVEISSDRIRQHAHPRMEGYCLGQIQLTPIKVGSDSCLVVRMPGHEARASIEVIEKPKLPLPPTQFQFEYETYRLIQGKKRRINVLVPVEMIGHFGFEIRVTSQIEAVKVLNGGIARLRFDEQRMAYRGTVEVDPSGIGKSGTLIAHYGDAGASCRVVIATPQGGFSLDIELVNEKQGKFRAELVKLGDGRMSLRVFGQHSALQRYLGAGPDFENQNEPVARAVLAEVIASEVARYIVERKLKDAVDMDGAGFYAEQRDYLERYLSKCHRMMVPDAAA